MQQKRREWLLYAMCHDSLMSLGKMGIIKRIVHGDGSGLKVVSYGKSWFKGFLAILLGDFANPCMRKGLS